MVREDKRVTHLFIFFQKKKKKGKEKKKTTHPNLVRKNSSPRVLIALAIKTLKLTI
jgi:hypothetical protein